MEEAQVFTSMVNNSVKSKLFKKEDGVVLKIDSKQVSGKGHICNAEGKNGYMDDFTFAAREIGDIVEEEYLGAMTLAFTAHMRGIYGNKKVKVFLPYLKNADKAMEALKTLKRNVENAAKPAAPAQPPKAEPAKAAPAQPAPVAQEKPAPQPVQNNKPEAAPQPKVESNHTAAPVKETKAPEVKPEETKAPEVKPEETKKAEEVKVEAPKAEEKAKQEDALANIAGAAATRLVEEAASKEIEMTETEFQERMDKLAVLKDCGLLGDKEYVSKKLELVSQFCNLHDFNERIQKLIALKDCGLLSDKEFDANRIDVIKECCNLDADDIKEYRRNVQKLSFLKMGDVISAEEYDKSKESLIQDVKFKVEDSKEKFVRKLKRLPVLKDCRLISDEDYKKTVDDLFVMLEVSKADSRESLVNKLTKWPLLQQEQYMDATELQSKQDELITTYLDVQWKTPEELKAIINRMSALKEGECLTDEAYQERRELLLKEIDEVQEYTTRIAMYKLLPQVGFISESEYEGLKQKCIDKIFVSSNSVAEFKERANNLVELQKVGMLTDEEFATYKTKLMSEL